MKVRFLLLLTGILFSINAFAQKSEVKYVTGYLGYYIHTIKEGETLSGLSVLYKVSVKNIKEVNPTISDIENIKYGQRIVIPNFDDFQEKYPYTDWEYVLYKIQKGDKLKSIAKDFDSDVKYIKDINRNIDTKPEESSLIRIPVKRANPLMPKALETNNNEPKDSKNPAIDFNWTNEKNKESEKDKSSKDCKNYAYKKGDSFNILYSLPLDLNKEKKSSSGIHFLEGALLAIEKIKMEGVSLTIHIIEEAQAINDSKKNYDLIISLDPGAELVAFSEKHKIPLVASYVPKLNRKAQLNPYLFQLHPSDDAIYNKMTSLPADPADVVLLIRPLYTDTVMYNNYKMALTKKYGKFKEHIHTVGLRSNLTEIAADLNKNANNLIFVCSNNEPFVSDFIDRLVVSKIKGYPIKLYGRFPWRSFKIIDPAKFFDLNLHLVQPFYVDYNNPKVISFVNEYRLTYNSDPIQFAIHGYDVTEYFLSAIKKFGSNFKDCINNFETQNLLQSRIKFEKTDDGAYINTEPLLLEYSSTEIDIIKK